jgi:hypothetical protein
MITRNEVIQLLKTISALWPSFPFGGEEMVAAWLEQAQNFKWTFQEGKNAITSLQSDARDFGPSFSTVNDKIQAIRQRTNATKKPLPQDTGEPASEEVMKREIAEARKKYPHLLH